MYVPRPGVEPHLGYWADTLTTELLGRASLALEFSDG